MRKMVSRKGRSVKVVSQKRESAGQCGGSVKVLSQCACVEVFAEVRQCKRVFPEERRRTGGIGKCVGRRRRVTAPCRLRDSAGTSASPRVRNTASADRKVGPARVKERGLWSVVGRSVPHRLPRASVHSRPLARSPADSRRAVDDAGGAPASRGSACRRRRSAAGAGAPRRAGARVYETERRPSAPRGHAGLAL